MIKKSALILASTALAGVLACSTPTALNAGGFEALTAKKSVVNQDYGYDFFGNCVIESTCYVDSENFVGDYTNKIMFNNWSPVYMVDYTDIDWDIYRYERVNTRGVRINEVTSTTYLGSIEFADPYYYQAYRREYYTYVEDENGIAFETVSTKVYSTSPFIVPLAFLRQFILGFNLMVQGGVLSFEGNLRVYDYVNHRFDSRSLSPTSNSNAVDPTSFDNIFSESRYILDTTNLPSNFDHLYYNGDWVFVSFFFEWETDGEEEVLLEYENTNGNQELFDLFEESSPAQLLSDTFNLWQLSFGDRVYLEQVNPPDLIFGTVESFLSTEFMPDFSFGDLLLIVLGVMVFGAFLKVFLGG